MNMRILAMVLAGGVGERLRPLTCDRVKPAVPFGGGYRLIDFTLSNCLNSQIRHICVLTQYKSLSLERHIRYGWSFLPHTMGEFIQVLPPQQRVNSMWYQGTADAVYQNLYSIEQTNPDYVLVLAGDHVYKMNYLRMIRAHMKHKAAVTVGTIEVPVERASSFGVVEVDDDGWIRGFEEKPEKPKTLPGKPGKALVSMGIYVFSAWLLKRVLAEDSSDPESSHDFGKDILPKLVQHVPVYAFPFVDENRKDEVYWRDVGTLDAYWEANMDLVSVDPVFNLYDEQWPINTYHVPAPPAKFVFADLELETGGGRAGFGMDSLVSPGCILAGGQVIQSVLAPKVRINEKARVEQSILHNDVVVGAGCFLYRTIVDKGVTIPPGMEIGIDHEQDRKQFTVSESGVVVVRRKQKLESV
jgi:glucose-1-phosphate adenylyltransferase